MCLDFLYNFCLKHFSFLEEMSEIFFSSRWRYSPGWALASATICLQVSRFLAVSLHSFIPIFLRSTDTSSNHLILGLPLRLVAYSFPYSIFFWDTLVQTKQRKWGMTFGTWNVRSLYRAGSLTAAARELVRRRIFRKWDVGVWTASSWLRIGTGGGHL